MKKLILILFFGIIASSLSEIVINEIIPAPNSPEPEWIELYVFVKNENLSNYTIADLSTEKNLPDTIIKANTFVILTKSADEIKSIREIPASAVIIEMPIPSLNNSEDAVILKSENFIDSVFYTDSDYQKGVSIERRNIYEAFRAGNMAVSNDKSGATCGYKNSTSREDYDLEITMANYSIPDNIIFIKIKNSGNKKSTIAQIRLSLDEEELLQEDIPEIEINDSLLLEIELDNIDYLQDKAGNLEIAAEIIFEKDEKPDNNYYKFEIYLPYKNSAIIINEIMFDTEGENYEFIELFNLESDTVNLMNWRLYDIAAGFDAAIIINDFQILPQSYSLIAWEDKILERQPALTDFNNYFISDKKLNLNKSGDGVFISDPTGKVIDSVNYLEKWHEPSQVFTANISLEKFSPGLPSDEASSWTSSASSNGSTPGAVNSVYTRIKFEGELSASPNPFAPNGNFNENQCFITYKLPYSRVRMNAKIYSRAGIEVNELANNLYASAEGVLIWDGTDRNGDILPIGAYIIHFEILDLATNNIYENNILVVIGEK